VRISLQKWQKAILQYTNEMLHLIIETRRFDENGSEREVPWVTVFLLEISRRLQTALYLPPRSTQSTRSLVVR
jgi:hypothetical protein